MDVVEVRLTVYWEELDICMSFFLMLTFDMVSSFLGDELGNLATIYLLRQHMIFCNKMAQSKVTSEWRKTLLRSRAFQLLSQMLVMSIRRYWCTC